MQILNWQLLSANTQAVTGLTLSHAPTANISQRLTFGLEQLTSDMRNIRPFGFLLFQEGIIGNTQWNNSLFTADYAGSVEVGISENLRSTWSVGGQYISEREADTWLWGRNFPGPGEHTSSSGATTGGEEREVESEQGGALRPDALFGYHDRYFVTLGLRLDGNSVFGEDFGIERYPKISASYVISDEAWWSPSWGETKLRGAYGIAGQAPGAFDALRTWTPAGFRGTPGFLPGTIGNPNLGPERSVELEVGFDSSLLDGRLAVDFTYYRQTTEDALFAVSQIPSVGFGGSQLENVGKIRNRGIELSISGDVLQSEESRLERRRYFSDEQQLGPQPGWSVGVQSERIGLGCRRSTRTRDPRALTSQSRRNRRASVGRRSLLRASPPDTHDRREQCDPAPAGYHSLRHGRVPERRVHAGQRPCKCCETGFLSVLRPREHGCIQLDRDGTH